MATIGSFTAGKDGYIGTIRTLTVNVKARIVANDAKKSEGAPDFRVYAGRAELGAANRWDGADPTRFVGTYEDYLVRKVSNVFPELAAAHIAKTAAATAS